MMMSVGLDVTDRKDRLSRPNCWKCEENRRRPKGSNYLLAWTAMSKRLVQAMLAKTLSQSKLARLSSLKGQGTRNQGQGRKVQGRGIGSPLKMMTIVGNSDESPPYFLTTAFYFSSASSLTLEDTIFWLFVHVVCVDYLSWRDDYVCVVCLFVCCVE